MIHQTIVLFHWHQYAVKLWNIRTLAVCNSIMKHLEVNQILTSIFSIGLDLPIPAKLNLSHLQKQLIHYALDSRYQLK